MCLFFEVLTFQSLLWDARGLLLGVCQSCCLPSNAATRVVRRERRCFVRRGSLWGDASEQAFGHHWDLATNGGCGGVNDVIASSVIMWAGKRSYERAFWVLGLWLCLHVSENAFFFFITVFCCDKCGEQGSSVKMFWKLLFLCVCVWYERRIILYCRRTGESLQRPHFWYRACEM